MNRKKSLRTVKKVIALPPDLSRFATTTARAEDKKLSAILQDALRTYRLVRLCGEYRELQGHWSQRLRDDFVELADGVGKSHSGIAPDIAEREVAMAVKHARSAVRSRRRR